MYANGLLEEKCKMLHSHKFYKKLVIGFSIFTVLFFGLIVMAYINLHNRSTILHELSTLKVVINKANIHIRDAALAPTSEAKLARLNARFETRKVAEEALVILSKANFTKAEKAVYLKMRLARNMYYRETQNKVINAIMDNASKDVLWVLLLEYEAHQYKYLDYLDELIQSVVMDITTKYRLLLEAILAFISLTIIAANYFVSLVPPQRRKCYECQCDLPQKLSLTLSKSTVEKTYPVRVCEKCYFLHMSRLKIPEVQHDSH